MEDRLEPYSKKIKEMSKEEFQDFSQNLLDNMVEVGMINAPSDYIVRFMPFVRRFYKFRGE